jgi:regulator of replication initiation timing
VDSPQYDFVSNLPPFLREQEGFLGIQNDFKMIMEQCNPLNSDDTCPLPRLEQVYSEECFTWIHRYYQDIPYLQAQINQVMARNIVLERENFDLRASLQQNSPRASKRSRKSRDDHLGFCGERFVQKMSEGPQCF